MNETCASGHATTLRCPFCGHTAARHSYIDFTTTEGRAGSGSLEGVRAGFVRYRDEFGSVRKWVRLADLAQITVTAAVAR